MSNLICYEYIRNNIEKFDTTEPTTTEPTTTEPTTTEPTTEPTTTEPTTTEPTTTQITQPYDYSPNGTIIKYNYNEEIVNVPSNINGTFINAIGDDVFRDLFNITNIILPNSITTIGNNVFNNCTNLTSITLSTNLIHIGEFVFLSCTNLKSITLPDSITTIGNYAFADCGLRSINIPKNLKLINYNPFVNCVSLTTITNTNANYSTVNNILFNRDKTMIIVYPAGKTDIMYDVPVSVENIVEYAFIGCYYLIKITISNKNTNIGYGAFNSCSGLISVNLSCNIGINSFQSCTNLTRINMSNDITLINSGAFKSCTNLPSITIPDSVNIIGVSAFSDCIKLTNITFNGKLPNIGTNAFKNIGDNVNVYHYMWSLDDEETFKKYIQYDDDTINHKITFINILKASSLSVGINKISVNAISIDITTLQIINVDINTSIDKLMLDTYPGITYTTNQIDNILYINIGRISSGEYFSQEIRYVVFIFSDNSQMQKLLNLDINKYKSTKSINPINYILLVIMILLIIYIIFRLNNIIRW